LGAIFFAFQIYGDFSGYSDIALGTARLFGIELLRNFAFPYLSRDIAEFWRRWHISLSTWFRDYLYIPLGGSKGGMWMKIRNTFIIFLVSGFWHGANWTFIVWGLLNAIYIMPSIIFGTNRNNLEVVAAGRCLPTAKELFSICVTFSLTVFAWIFFRAEDISHAFRYIVNMFTGLADAKGYIESWDLLSQPVALVLLVLLIFFLVMEWRGREGQYALADLGLGWSKVWRYVLYYSIVISVFWFSGKQQEFIYFQF
jgi:D-alanyl-lipoteichoic acid acyltransferase DltB (MBOAT superfamily)